MALFTVNDVGCIVDGARGHGHVMLEMVDGDLMCLPVDGEVQS